MDDQRICHEVLNFIQIDPGHTVKEISMEVYEMAKTVLGTSSNYLIGINSIDRSGNQWQYASDGSPKRFTDYGYGSGLDGGNECAALYSSNGFAEDQGCTHREKNTLLPSLWLYWQILFNL